MRIFRRWLASGALALTALQLALLFTAPVSACCRRPAAANAAISAASEDAPDCCPPGAHPKGECPLHRGARSEARSARIPGHCRFTCGQSSGPQFLLGAIGILPRPDAAIVSFAESSAPESAPAIVPFRPSVPDAPPPKLLS